MYLYLSLVLTTAIVGAVFTYLGCPPLWFGLSFMVGFIIGYMDHSFQRR